MKSVKTQKFDKKKSVQLEFCHIKINKAQYKLYQKWTLQMPLYLFLYDLFGEKEAKQNTKEITEEFSFIIYEGKFWFE